MAVKTYPLGDVGAVRDRLLERAIGKFILNWCIVEHYVEILIWEILELDPLLGSKITSRMDIRPRTELLETVATQCLEPGPFLDDIKRNTKQIADILPARNDMMHGFWFREKKSGHAYVGSLRREKNEQILPRLITTRFVLANVHDAILISKNLRAFQAAIRAHRGEPPEPTP